MDYILHTDINFVEQEDKRRKKKEALFLPENYGGNFIKQQQWGKER